MLEKDKEILRLRKILEESNKVQSLPRNPYKKLEEGGILEEKIRIVKLMNRRHDEDLKPYMFAMWRLKFLLKRGLRLKGRKD